MEQKVILGVDVGGSGIKGALVDLNAGTLITERHRIPTPKPATPGAVADVIHQILKHFEWEGPVGCGFPAAMSHGVARTAANISKSWIGVNAEQLLLELTGSHFAVINDADAAGLAEMRFGAGKGQKGVTILTTLGTGIGTAVFLDDQLLPNTELGHIHLPGHKEDAERYAADSARKREDLSWSAWGKRYNEYLTYMYERFFPDRFIVGGGASKKFAKYEEHIKVPVPVVPCQLLNQAGIVGAALAGEHLLKQ